MVIRLLLHYLDQKGESKGIIQFHSGTGIPQDVYRNYVIYLAEAGFTVVTFDYRGVAASAPNNLKGFQASLQDWGS